jgi:small acid-soluble spore protein F (minor alpha/beta-type SASP)
MAFDGCMQEFRLLGGCGECRRFTQQHACFSGTFAWNHTLGVIALANRRPIVSDEVKYEIARELGFADKIQVGADGYDYGNITTREAGLIVRSLIEKAQRAMADQLTRRGQ